MNPRLVASLLVSTVVAIVVAGAMLAHGWGILLAYLAFSASGAVALVAASFLAAWRAERRRHPPAPLGARPRKLAQST